MEEYIRIGNIDISKYQDLCSDKILTEEVIFTYKQIEHTNQKHQNIYEKYKEKLKDVIENPDYIIEDTKHKETGLVIKKYSKDVVIVLRLNTENRSNKNSIITIWEIKEKRLER